MTEVAWLVFNGVDISQALEMDDLTRAWLAIKFGEFNGSKFNIETMQFDDNPG